MNELVSRAKDGGRHYPLTTQMRVRAGADFVGYVRRVMGSVAGGAHPESFEGYDLRFFDSVGEMRDAIYQRDSEVGLSRIVAGFAWAWKSQNDKSAFDIEEQGHTFRWNSVQTDWVSSPNALSEVGSIHTVQGYDLNYTGVIIGPDLKYDPVKREMYFDRESYFDAKGKENNRTLGKIYTDEDLLRFVSNIYAVLLTRGILGTYVYVSDPALRAYLRPFFTAERVHGSRGRESITQRRRQ
ncbi:DNA/RNA helicase domain-containing protein [Leifsonia sp. McL0607]|uniref:DNA/RNA helicase domain-containing protein n=1 Tax=Leifsonia sp. McL0607 TaxID=3415672 RepID=UPI003CF7DC18